MGKRFVRDDDVEPPNAPYSFQNRPTCRNWDSADELTDSEGYGSCVGFIMNLGRRNQISPPHHGTILTF